LWHVRARDAVHRKWRARQGHMGDVVHMDESEHDWFEGRRAKAFLILMIDDATNWTHAKFFESETHHGGDVSIRRICRVPVLSRSARRSKRLGSLMVQSLFSIG
jgi:hypothetical protein